MIRKMSKIMIKDKQKRGKLDGSSLVSKLNIEKGNGKAVNVIGRVMNE